MNQQHAEELEWARLRVLIAAEREATAEQLRLDGESGVRSWHEAKSELRSATLCLRAHAAKALRTTNPLFWHDRFGRPRNMGEREYQLSA